MHYAFGPSGYKYQPIAGKFEMLTVNTSVGITTALLTMTDGTPATYALIGPIETDQIRVRFDGTAPTAASGHLFQIGDSFELFGAQYVKNFLAIKVTNSASVPISLGF
jgi:hypothetical protein